MNEIAGNLIDGAIQCYGCPIFDRLFQIVSESAAAIYRPMAFLATLIFVILFAFYVVNAVWQNIKKDVPDPWYQKSIRPVIINSLIALTFLWAGVGLPRLITTATFEPVTEISLIYTQSMLNIDNDVVNERVTYQPMKMSDDGFFRPQLRDKIIMLMKTTITQFQSYMKLGIAVMDTAFTWRALLGIGSLVKHIILFFVGLYIFYAFFKLFFRFCCYFADIIVAMALFAFFFPLSLVLIAFRGADNVPSWISGLGKDVGINQFKNLINAIVALASAVITYTVIMVIIARFFTSPDASVDEIITAITTGNVFNADLSDDNIESLTIMGTVVLVYVINFIQTKIPEVSNMVMSAFNVKPDNKLSEQLANDAMALTSATFNTVKNVGKIIINGGETKDKKDDKK
ncbi:MAG: hypothetical protein IJ866_01845 [Alphaproteobacteria bacterium]|nr:hypothetical protein [Alphaproteobacteria bacterium]